MQNLITKYKEMKNILQANEIMKSKIEKDGSFEYSDSECFMTGNIINNGVLYKRVSEKKVNVKTTKEYLIIGKNIHAIGTEFRLECGDEKTMNSIYEILYEHHSRSSLIGAQKIKKSS